MSKYTQPVLVGRRKRKGVLTSSKSADGSLTFSISISGVFLASRTVTKRYDEEKTIRRLSKAVSGFSYVFVIPVSYDGDSAKERYFKVNN